MSRTRESENVSRAKDILRGVNATLEELKQLATKLKEEKAFGFARKLLQRACLRPELAQDQKMRIRLIQQYALCTYKDLDLPLDISFALFRPSGSPVLLGFSEADAIFSNTLVDRKCAQESKKSAKYVVFRNFHSRKPRN